MSAWSLAESQDAENILSTSLHVAAEIYAFFWAYLDFGFRMALYRAAKSPYSFVR